MVSAFLCGQILAQDCSQILQHGIYDTSAGISDTERAASFVAWFKENTFSSYSEAKNYAGQVGIPIDDVLVTLGFSADEKGYSEFRQSINWYQQQDILFKQKLEHYVSTINQGVVQAWEHCITSSGLHFWIIQKSDPTVFVLAARYISSGAPSPKLKSIQFEPSDAVAIESGPFFKKRFFSSKMAVRKIQFDGNVLSQAFHRTKPGVLTVIVNGSEDSGLQTDLPDAYPKPLPFIREFAVLPTTIYAGQSSKLDWIVNGANSVLIDQGLGMVTNVGSVQVTPQQSTKYKITAENDGGTVSMETNLTVNPVFVTSIQAVWTTTGDDKDWNTQANMDVIDNNGRTVAHVDCCSADRSGDHWEKPQTHYAPLVLRVSGLTLGDLQHGHFNSWRVPVGNDDWDYTASIVVSTSTGQQLTLGTKSGRNSVTGSW